MLKIDIDPSMCLGSGMCELMAGHLFKVGESGVAEPVKAFLESPDLIDAATDAMNGCPAGAIRLSNG